MTHSSLWRNCDLETLKHLRTTFQVLSRLEHYDGRQDAAEVVAELNDEIASRVVMKPSQPSYAFPMPARILRTMAATALGLLFGGIYIGTFNISNVLVAIWIVVLLAGIFEFMAIMVERHVHFDRFFDDDVFSSYHHDTAEPATSYHGPPPPLVETQRLLRSSETMQHFEESVDGWVTETGVFASQLQPEMLLWWHFDSDAYPYFHQILEVVKVNLDRHFKVKLKKFGGADTEWVTLDEFKGKHTVRFKQGQFEV